MKQKQIKKPYFSNKGNHYRENYIKNHLPYYIVPVIIGLVLSVLVKLVIIS
jgi:hypothetical protein